MSTMNVSLPAPLKAFVDDQVQSCGYGTSSEFVRELIRRERDRQSLRAMIMEGVQSPVAGSADAAYFAALRKGAGRTGKAGGRKR